MSRAHSLFRRFGRLTLPLDETGDDNLVALDPARDILLDLFTAALNCELEPVWERAVVGTPLEGRSPVQLKLPALPEEEKLGQMKADFPMLAVGRSVKPATIEAWSLDQDQLKTLWDVDYVLCPLSLTNEMRVRDVLQAVGKTLVSTVRAGGHKAYLRDANGYAAGVRGDDGQLTCGFFSCRVTEFAAAPAQFAKDGPPYLAVGLTLETVEVSSSDDDGESVPMVGATLNAGLTQSGDPKLEVRG